MEVKILKENLDTAIGLVSRFTNQAGHMPALGFVEMVAEGKELYMQATDLKKSIRLQVAGKVVSEGRALVPAKLMVELVHSLPLGAVQVQVSGEEMVLRAGKMRAKLSLGSVDDFPSIEDRGGDMVSWGGVTVADLSKAWSGVGFVVSKDDSRPVLTGGLWELKKGKLVATDGYRLSVVEGVVKLKKKEVGVGSVLVPGSVWQEVIKVFEELGMEKVSVSYDEVKGQLRFEADGVVLVGSLIEGDYPNYQAIVPSEFATLVKVRRDELLKAVRAVTIFARDTANIVKLEVGKSSLKLMANTPQLGEGEVEVDVEVEKSAGGVIAFNGKYLVDYLTHSGSDVIEVGMNEALQPARFQGMSEGEFLHVIMPVRVKE